MAREDASPWKRHAAVCAQLRLRNTPARPPPRVLVFTGPAGAGKRKVMAGLVKAHPALFGRLVTHTTRRPREHEVDGVDYHFTDAPTLRCARARRLVQYASVPPILVLIVYSVEQIATIAVSASFGDASWPRKSWQQQRLRA
jgi:Guanylate kinase